MKNQTLSQLNKEDRPVCHLTPETGWLNDPNGFSRYGGKYHLFYQSNPLDTCWGAPRWGHVASTDLLHWERLPEAMTPDRPYDIDGCFSGTAIDTGEHMLMYTGFRLDPDDAKGRGIQTQCMAFGDGLTYRKYEANPVLTEQDLPEHGDPHEFRDPKLWQEPDGSFRAIIANHNGKEGAQLLLYGSSDGRHWDFRKVLMTNKGKPGWMWECPDFFRMEDRQTGMQRQVVLVSTMGEVECLCIIGDYDRESETFRETAWQTLEQGFDLYAPETIETPDGRRVLIGWMQNPQTAESRGVEYPINGQMSLPRELTLECDRIRQWPIRELDELHEDKVVRDAVRIEDEEIRLEGVNGRIIDMTVSIRPADGSETDRRRFDEFRMRFAKDETHYTEFCYEPETSMVTLDRSHAGPGSTELLKRQTKVAERNGRLDLRIVLDRLSAEIFINDGEQVMSAVIYTDRHAEDITFYVKGTAVMDIAKYRIKENK